MSRSLLARAQTLGTPLIDAEGATFIWRGPTPPQLIGDFNGWVPGRAPAWEQVEPDLWSCRLQLPADAYMEYGFTEGDDPDGRIPDPFNPRTVPNGVGQINHYFYMPPGGPTPLAQRVRGVAQGQISRHVIEDRRRVVGGRRAVHLYRPPGEGPFPLVVVYDGQDYLRRGRLAHIADNLIAQGRMRPVALALVDNGGQARVVEYACSEATVGFVLQAVLPLAAEQMPLVDLKQEEGAFGVLGASMGGLMALFTALRYPRVFGHVLSQSGAFGSGDDESVVFDLVRHGPPVPLKVWMDVGRFEWLLESNRQMGALLQQRGYEVAYREFNAGHNYPAWRDDVWRGLEWLYPHRHQAEDVPASSRARKGSVTPS